MAWNSTFTNISNKIFGDTITSADCNQFQDNDEQIQANIEALKGGVLGVAPSTTLESLASGSTTTVTTKTTDYTVLDGDGVRTILCDASGGTVTITLPTAADNTDRVLDIININDTFLVDVDGEGAETINGKTSLNMPTQYNKMTIVCNGTAWFVKNEQLSYETAWVNTSDWTNMDLTVNHTLNAPLSDLIIKFIVSTDGTDANSFNFVLIQGANANVAGISFYATDDNNFKIETGTSGIRFIDSAGASALLDTENWYYKVVVYKLRTG